MDSSSGAGATGHRAPERADGRRNRRAILAAASSAFAANPQVSVSEIAERAGLTRATIYRHYPDRDDLVAAVAAEAADRLVPVLLEEMARLDWGDALDLLAERTVTLGAERRDLVMLMAPRLEESMRLAVAGEPIQEVLTVRRERGEITTDLSDRWLALSIRSICVAAINQLADSSVDTDLIHTELARTLRLLCGTSLR